MVTAAPAKQPTAKATKAPLKQAKQNNTLAAVRVAGVNLAGLTPDEARRRIARALSKKLDFQHTMTDGRRFIKRKRRDLGIYLAVEDMLKRAQSGQKSVPLLLDVKASELQRALSRLSPQIAFRGSPARVGEYRGKVVISPHQNVRSLNVAGATQSVIKQFRKNSGNRILRLSVIERPPALTTARLKGINARLASFSTEFNPGKVKRTNNVKLGIRSIDGTLLSNGEVFSLNKTVGERTQLRGYRTSIIFKNGYQTPGIGAGVSQVTGTLFNAALMAGLPIVEYRTHSRPVVYLPLGRDATVAWGGFDMKFKNNTGAPVYIAYKIGGSRAIATLYGAQRAKADKVSLKVNSQKLGPREIKAQLYRWIRRDSKTVKQKVGSSHYKWNVGAWED